MQRIDRWAAAAVFVLALALLDLSASRCQAAAERDAEESAGQEDAEKKPKPAEEKKGKKSSGKSAKKQANAPRGAKKQGAPAQTAEEQTKMLDQLNDAFSKMSPREAQEVKMVEQMAQFLPGNEALYYVLVLQGTNVVGKSREIFIGRGRTGAAKAIVDFLRKNPDIVQNPRAHTRWLMLEMYPNELLATARYRALMNYTFRSGYR